MLRLAVPVRLPGRVEREGSAFMKSFRTVFYLATAAVGVSLANSGRARAQTEMFEYLAKPEPKFSWRVIDTERTNEGTIARFAFTSQNWRGIDWTHQLRVYVPTDLKYTDHVLLFITGGSSTSQVKPEDDAQGFALARACGGRVAVLPQVPNQPLLGGKTEDDLIGETFVNYLATQESDWPLLLPMVKSAVKAMDAVEEWGRETRAPVKGFVVTGASKRGWTTWLTAAVDERVKAIAPMVIPTLNMKAQTIHQKESWGFFSEQIEDYTRRGLTEKFDDPVGAKLWRMVDPYSYLDRIKVPVLQINGTNDRYWTLDSMNVYWDDIKAPKYVVYLPNAGHDLKAQREWAVNGVGSLFRHVASGRELPKITEFREGDNANGKPRFKIECSAPAPSTCAIWTAQSRSLDFREAAWERVSSTNGASDAFEIPADYRNSAKRLALLGDLTFEIDGLQYHLSTPIWIVGQNKP